MAEIKVLALDLDGTLTNSQKEVTPRTRAALNAAIAKGVTIVLASGRPTAYGNIAVDPSVFPYGTQFYIYTDDGYMTYGMATASDCGTSIKGYKLDLWFDEYSQACAFGRRNCTVFVLS